MALRVNVLLINTFTQRGTVVIAKFGFLIGIDTYMRNIVTTTFLLLSLITVGFSQGPSPVNWTTSAEKTADGAYLLTFAADIKQDWVIYGMEEHDDGPIPTSINFEEGSFELDGTVASDSESIITDDKLFMIKLEKFKNKAIFTQKVKAPDGETVKGWITYMTCDGERCLPPTDVDFSLELK